MDELFNKRVKIGDGKWLSTHKEYLRWKKTDSFTKWQHRQFLNQGGTCYYCDEPLKGTRQNIDHIIPKSKGGSNDKKNLVIACSLCNRNKNATLLTPNERLSLKKHNAKKKGTYQKVYEEYKSEYDIGYELRQMFKHG